MRHSRKMQAQIEKMAKARDIDLSQAGSYFKAKSPGFMDLVVESIGQNQVSVAHYYEQNSDLCQDPEIVFFVAGGEWSAIEWTTPPVRFGGREMGGYKRVAEQTENGWRYYKRDQRELAIFANKWADNIQMQGFK